MSDTLKAAGRIGAELGAAKAENERLRGLLREVIACQAAHYGDGTGLHLAMITLADRLKGALSQQPEPTDTYTAVDMATAAAQGFRDGQAAVEQATAQDEQQPEQSRPANKLRALAEIWDQNADEADEFGNAQAAEALRLAAFELRATLSAPQGKFRMGDLVKKSTGSEWEGRVVGWYSTEQTKEGYAVESEAHAGSVQIYPAKALEAVE